MKKIFIAATSATALLMSGAAIADNHDPADYFPIEGWSCKYNEGMGPDDLNAAVDAWNAWADERDVTTYWGGSLTPYYFSPSQEFDFVWLGGWTSGAAMGAGTDMWLSEGSEIGAQFQAVATCDGHTQFAATETMSPPDNDDPSDTLVLTFQDCDVGDDATGSDVVDALKAWAVHAGEEGFVNGMWVLWPVFGGGDAEFDFKLLTGEGSWTELGENWDRWEQNIAAWNETIGGKFTCDEGRVYNTAVHRRPAEDEG